MTADIIARAMGYPYDPPTQSYVIRGDRVRRVQTEGDLPDLSGRVPVLAVGSNQGPAQLARKYDPKTTGRDWDDIPVLRVELDDFDTVYSPHISAYGAIPATLQNAPGTKVTLFVTWLTSPQLERMHETEIAQSNYVYGLLSDVSMRAEVGPQLSEIHIYASRHGTLQHEGGPIPLRQVPALNRAWAAKDQSEVQALARDWLAPDTSVEDFILGSVAAPETRRSRTEQLKAGCIPFDHPRFRVLAG